MRRRHPDLQGRRHRLRALHGGHEARPRQLRLHRQRPLRHAGPDLHGGPRRGRQGLGRGGRRPWRARDRARLGGQRRRLRLLQRHDRLRRRGQDRDGHGQSDGFVAKYDATAMLEWMVQLGDTGNDQANAVAVDASDNVYVVGNFSNKVTFQTMPTATTITGGPGIFVAKLDKSGKPQWANGYTGNGIHVRRRSPSAPTAPPSPSRGSPAAISPSAPRRSIPWTRPTTPTASSSPSTPRAARSAGSGRSRAAPSTRTRPCTGWRSTRTGASFVVGSAKGDVDFGDTLPVDDARQRPELRVCPLHQPRRHHLEAAFVGQDNTVQTRRWGGPGPGRRHVPDRRLPGSAARLPRDEPGRAPWARRSSTNATFVVRLDGSGSGVWGKAFTPTNLGSPERQHRLGRLHHRRRRLFSRARGRLLHRLAGDPPGPVADAGADAGSDAGDGGRWTRGATPARAARSPARAAGTGWRSSSPPTSAPSCGQRSSATPTTTRSTAWRSTPARSNPLGASAVAGQFAKSVNVGGGPVSCIGSNDIFFARLAP